MGSIFTMKEIDVRISEIILHGGEKQVESFNCLLLSPHVK